MLQHGFISYYLLTQSLHGQHEVFQGKSKTSLEQREERSLPPKKILGLNNQVNVFFFNITDDDKGDTKVEDIEGDDMKE